MHCAVSDKSKRQAASLIIDAKVNQISFSGIDSLSCYFYTSIAVLVVVIIFMTDVIANFYAVHDLAIVLSFVLLCISLFELILSTHMSLVDLIVVIGCRATCNASCHLFAFNIV